jgi:hypothetical protein
MPEALFGGFLYVAFPNFASLVPFPASRQFDAVCTTGRLAEI